MPDRLDSFVGVKGDDGNVKSFESGIPQDVAGQLGAMLVYLVWKAGGTITVPTSAQISKEMGTNTWALDCSRSQAGTTLTLVNVKEQQ